MSRELDLSRAGSTTDIEPALDLRELERIRQDVRTSQLEPVRAIERLSAAFGSDQRYLRSQAIDVLMDITTEFPNLANDAAAVISDIHILPSRPVHAYAAFELSDLDPRSIAHLREELYSQCGHTPTASRSILTLGGREPALLLSDLDEHLLELRYASWLVSRLVTEEPAVLRRTVADYAFRIEDADDESDCIDPMTDLGVICLVHPDMVPWHWLRSFVERGPASTSLTAIATVGDRFGVRRDDAARQRDVVGLPPRDRAATAAAVVRDGPLAD